MHTTAYHGHLEIAKFLKEKGAKVDSEQINKWTPLHLGKLNYWLAYKYFSMMINQFIACQENRVEIVSYLLDNGASLEKKQVDGWLPLHIACKKDQIQLVRALCKKGAVIDATQNEGWTALHIAIYNGNLEVVKFLCNNGANVNLQLKNGATSLIIGKLRKIIFKFKTDFVLKIIKFKSVTTRTSQYRQIFV